MKSKIKNKEKFIYTLEEVVSEHIGNIGSQARNEFEDELALELLGDKIKNLRKSNHLTQEELGKVLGVQKSQISKLEKDLSNAKLSTILKVFNALNASITFNVESKGAVKS